MSHQDGTNMPGATSSSGSTESIHILHVDDDAAILELTSEFLRREMVGIQLDTATSAADGLDLLVAKQINCIISDYNMPQLDGLEFLREVREIDEDLPFILYTGRGSEEIASKAISAGVTDYLQKESSADHYKVLANKVKNAVAKFKAEQAVEETQERYQKLIQHSTDVVSIVDAQGCWQYLSPSAERVLGYSPGELIGDIGFDHIHPDERQDALDAFAKAIENPEFIPSVEFRFDHPAGWIWLENRARNMVDDPIIKGFVVHTRDVTERKEHERQLARQNDRLEEIINTISHDLRNPLGVAMGHLEIFDDAEADPQLSAIRNAHSRMEQIIDDLVTMAHEGEDVIDPEPVGLKSIIERGWQSVETKQATLHVDDLDGVSILANPSRLQRLFENLFRNGVEHAGDSTTIQIGMVSNGVFIEDDGPGIPPEERDKVFESGFSTSESGTGFGLAIVKQIVSSHGWEIMVSEGERGGTRMEISGVEFI